MGEDVPPNIIIEIKLEKKQKKGHEATEGTLKVYLLSQKEKKYGKKGKNVLTVPIVSGGRDKDNVYAPVKKGTYKNVRATTANKGTGSDELKDDAHGGGDNIIIRLYDDVLIHQGNRDVAQEGAYTKGCVAITAYEYKNKDGRTDVERNYDDFSKVIRQGGKIDVIIK